VWLVGVVSVWQAESCHTDTHNQCGDTIEKSQAPDDGFKHLCI